MIVGINEAAETPEQRFNNLMSIGSKLASQKSRVLCEDKRLGMKLTMGDLLEGLPEGHVRNNTAIMINNTREYFDNLSETSKLVNIGDFEKYAFIGSALSA